MRLAVVACLLSAASCRTVLMGPDVVEQNKGHVTVLLLGMERCPGTEAATGFLAGYSANKPDGVVLFRVDVPPPGKTVGPAHNVASNLNYVVDNGRRTADRLEFFFYPTLYIIDGDGVVRFSGACEPDRVKAMVAEIRAEAPGAEKKMYTLPLARIGQVIPDFTVTDADNHRKSFAELGGESGALIFFSATTCPFSVKALDELEKVKRTFRDRKVGFVIVNLGQSAADVKDMYARKSPGTAVVIDADKSISLTQFGVTAVPFMYVLDKNRKVVDRRPFAYDAAKAAVGKLLGMKASGGCGPAGGSGAG